MWKNKIKKGKDSFANGIGLKEESRGKRKGAKTLKTHADLCTH
jgi:hypothetical protein